MRTVPIKATDVHPEPEYTTPPLRKRPRPADDEGGNDYAVGYKKPPVHTRFKKGKSGNPKGRPKHAKSLNTIIREEMLAKVPVRTSAGVRYISRAHALVLKRLEQASKGNDRAMDKLFERYDVAVPGASEEATENADLLDFTNADQEILRLLTERLIGGAK